MAAAKRHVASLEEAADFGDQLAELKESAQWMLDLIDRGAVAQCAGAAHNGPAHDDDERFRFDSVEIKVCESEREREKVF